MCGRSNCLAGEVKYRLQTCGNPDLNVCTCCSCVGGSCTFIATSYGDSACTGPGIAVLLDDILCSLDGYTNFASCPDGDIAPDCVGDGVIELGDILGVLDAYAGADPCGCVP